MTDIVRDWLPDAALTIARIGMALRPTFDQWSGDWFALAPAVSLGDAPARLSEQSEANLSLEAGNVQLLLTAMGKRHLLEAVLGETLAGKSLSLHDHHLLEKLVEKACHDLAQRLSALPIIASAAGTSVRKIGLLLSNNDCGRLAIPAAALPALVKSALGRARNPSSFIAGRKLALGPSTVAIDATLGQVSLTVEDMRGLEPGDVLVLDQPLADTFPVRLSDSGAVIGRAMLTKSQGHNALAWQD